MPSGSQSFSLSMCVFVSTCYKDFGGGAYYVSSRCLRHLYTVPISARSAALPSRLPWRLNADKDRHLVRLSVTVRPSIHACLTRYNVRFISHCPHYTVLYVSYWYGGMMHTSMYRLHRRKHIIVLIQWAHFSNKVECFHLACLLASNYYKVQGRPLAVMFS